MVSVLGNSMSCKDLEQYKRTAGPENLVELCLLQRILIWKRVENSCMHVSSAYDMENNTGLCGCRNTGHCAWRICSSSLYSTLNAALLPNSGDCFSPSFACVVIKHKSRGTKEQAPKEVFQNQWQEVRDSMSFLGLATAGGGRLTESLMEHPAKAQGWQGLCNFPKFNKISEVLSVGLSSTSYELIRTFSPEVSGSH